MGYGAGVAVAIAFAIHAGVPRMVQAQPAPVQTGKVKLPPAAAGPSFTRPSATDCFESPVRTGLVPTFSVVLTGLWRSKDAPLGGLTELLLALSSPSTVTAVGALSPRSAGTQGPARATRQISKAAAACVSSRDERVLGTHTIALSHPISCPIHRRLHKLHTQAHPAYHDSRNAKMASLYSEHS